MEWAGGAGKSGAGGRGRRDLAASAGSCEGTQGHGERGLLGVEAPGGEEEALKVEAGEKQGRARLKNGEGTGRVCG